MSFPDHGLQMPELPGAPPLGTKVSVWWHDLNDWLPGAVCEARSVPGVGAHRDIEVQVAYGDGSARWHSLAETQIRKIVQDPASSLAPVLPAPEMPLSGLPGLSGLSGLPGMSGLPGVPGSFTDLGMAMPACMSRASAGAPEGHTKEIHLPPVTSSMLAPPPCGGLEFSMPIQIALPVMLPQSGQHHHRPDLSQFHVSMNAHMHPNVFDPYSSLLPIAPATPLAAVTPWSCCDPMLMGASRPNDTGPPAPSMDFPPMSMSKQGVTMQLTHPDLAACQSAPPVEAAANAVTTDGRATPASLPSPVPPRPHLPRPIHPCAQ